MGWTLGHWLVWSLQVWASTGIYLPGNAPQEYAGGTRIPIEANKMSSSKTQVPYKMYTLDFCGPTANELEVPKSSSLGQILVGDVVQPTPYDVRMRRDEACKVLCSKFFNQSATAAFEDMIRDEYMINLAADDLPAAWKVASSAISMARHLQSAASEARSAGVVSLNSVTSGIQIVPGTLQQPVSSAIEPNQMQAATVMSARTSAVQQTAATAVTVAPNAAGLSQQTGEGPVQLEQLGRNTEILIPGGFPIGFKPAGAGSTAILDQMFGWVPATTGSGTILFNHLDLTILFNEYSEKKYRVVGFEVRPRSVSEVFRKSGGSCGQRAIEGGGLQLNASQAGITPVTFSYSVAFEPSPISWATRWDSYLASSAGPTSIHWFSILNSFLVVVILSGAVGTILLRTVLRDIAQYNALAVDLEDAGDESGWKQIHGDVFRRPRFSKLLATCCGTGIQVLTMIALTMFFAMIGILSPTKRGSLIQAMLISFAIMGWPAGYISARFTQLFLVNDPSRPGGLAHKRTHGDTDLKFDAPPPPRYFTVTFLTAFLYTGVCFFTFLVLNLILSLKQSSGAVPFGYLFLLVLLWVGISVPLVFWGAYHGYKQHPIKLPVRTNQIPRQIPSHPWYLRSRIFFATGGILPFGAAFSELSFIVASVWQHRFYTLFGFLSLILLILVATCAETSIVFTYFQLAAEDYRWWWKSFWVSAFSAVYFFIFSLAYFFNSLEITSLPSIILFFGYTGLMTYTFFLVTGAVGFLATFYFVKAIYGAVKVD